MSDRELLEKAIGGDRDGLGALLKRYGPTVRQKLVGKIAKRWQSLLSEDDVLQQTYADAFLDIRHFDAEREDSFGGWLTKMAERNLLDGVRMLESAKRGGDRRKIEPADLLDQLTQTGTTPSHGAARNEARAEVEAALGKLSDAHGRVVRMYDLEGRRVDEVAAAMGRSQGAVFMLRRRALEQLQRLLGGTNPIDF